MQDRYGEAHLRPVLERSRFAAWWWLVVIAGLVTLVMMVDLGAILDGPSVRTAFGVLVGFALLSELRPVVASRRTEGLVLSWAFLFALLLYAGVEVALVGVVVSSVVGGLVRRKRLYAIVFNVAQWAVVYALASEVLLAAGWAPAVMDAAPFTPRSLLAVGIAATVYHLVNMVLVGTAIALRAGRSIAREMSDGFWHYAWTTGAVLALAPVIVTLLEHHLALLPLLSLPLLLLQQTAAMSLASECRSLRDELTGLGNRLLLVDRFEAHRAVGQPLAVCVLDLDGFKAVNDTHGHAIGDEVLRRVAHRLVAGVRPEDTVTRLGGDEFVLLLDVGSVGEALEILERTVRSTQQPYEVEGLQLTVGVSCGVAVLPDHGDSLELLLRRADAAMYAAKERPEASATASPDQPPPPIAAADGPTIEP